MGEDRGRKHVSLGEVLAAYTRSRTTRKTPREQRSDARRSRMWARVLGRDLDPHELSMAAWERFVDGRSSGSVDAYGRPVACEARRPVGARTVEADCLWLRWVFNWATRWRTETATYLMRENPLRGLTTPKERNPRRPVATQDRFEAVRAVSDDIAMEMRWGRRLRCRSYLSELLDLVNGTGRRISAVCALRFEDLRLGEGPYGSIRWPAHTDKVGLESTVLVSPAVRRALDRIRHERPGQGTAPLFPSPKDPTRPMTRHLADKWLRRAERLAGLEPQKGSLWHAYRRKWATERKHHPDVDVAAAGGWKSVQTLKTAYQQADQATMLRVVLEPEELRG